MHTLEHEVYFQQHFYQSTLLNRYLFEICFKQLSIAHNLKQEARDSIKLFIDNMYKLSSNRNFN